MRETTGFDCSAIDEPSRYSMIDSIDDQTKKEQESASGGSVR